MDLFWPILFLIFTITTWTNVDGHYDIRKYYDNPYCEEHHVGKDLIKRCYKVEEVK